MKKIETYINSFGLKGVTVQELIKAFQAGMVSYFTANELNMSLDLIRMPGNRYIHVDNLIDLDEAEKTFEDILQRHFLQFGGYSNNRLLFSAALQELSMFLNDNDCANVEDVYSIARFLFEKKAVKEKSYKFYTPHIFEDEPNYPPTLKGLMIRLARSTGGILYTNDAKNYLQKTMLTYGSLGQLLQINSSNTFLMYDDNRYLLSEVIGIDRAWCYRIHEQLEDLFRKANVAYIIPRDIKSSWLETLPALPHNVEWTRLLLQEILDKYPAIGFKSVSAGLNQTYDTLAAAFVPIDSPLASFSDIVALFMEEHYKLPVRMSAEKLRQELREAGMLANNELLFALPKALDDYRFAWSNDNKTVYVRGNF